ncbi:MAG TPA: hypothetical protein VGG49_01550 [Steroidobacteraceae bacterium]|jgi:hypothetical protein
MRTLRRACAGLVIAASGVLGAVSSGAQGPATKPACDRECLQSLVDRYLKALVAHDPALVPLAPAVKITENGQNLGLQHGLWKTASADSTYRLYFADPSAGQVGFIGQLKENDVPVQIALRLKVADRMITEAETIVSRTTSFAKPENFVSPLPVLVADVPLQDRVSREQMIRIANSYFTGLDTDHSGRNVPFDPDCQRREDGNVSARSSDPKATSMQKMGCKAQFDTGFSVIVTKVRDRRYPIVDVQRGLVYSEVFFDHSGTVASFKIDGKEVAVGADYRRPKTFEIGELFKISKGKIRQIEAVLLDVPYGMKSGWGATPVTATATSSTSTPAPADCGHDCLLGFVDKYVAALVNHHPTPGLFSANARFTENAQPLKLGEALWRTVSDAPRGYQLVIADPTTGEAGFYMLMKENGNPIWLSGRLKVVHQKISQLETVVIRKGVSFGNFDRTAPSPLWNEVLTPAQRRPRAQLISIANKYFDALDHHLADSVPFADQCFRIENGVQTAGPPVPPAAALAMGGAAPAPRAAGASLGTGGKALPDVGHIGCRGNINSNMWSYITQIQPRRCDVVDEERGVVQCVVMFHQDGEVPSTLVPGYGEFKYSGATRRPFDTVIPEMFKVVDGKIVEIEATMASVPFGSHSGWE